MARLSRTFRRLACGCQGKKLVASPLIGQGKIPLLFGIGGGGSEVLSNIEGRLKRRQGVVMATSFE